MAPTHRTHRLRAVATSALLSAATLVFAVAGPASANAEHYGGSFGPTTLIDDGLCDFPVTVTLVGIYSGVVTPNGRDVSLNMRSTTFSAFGRSAGGTSPHIDLFSADSMTIVGLGFRVIVPGVGALAIDAGRAVFDQNGLSFLSGQHDIVAGDADKLCAYLSGA
jgi:hypothetical protein